MNNLKFVIDRINQNIKKEATNFVFYEADTGEIRKITNAFEESKECDCIEVPHDAVKDIITGRHKSSDYVVIFEPTTKSVSVKRKEDVTQKVKGYKQVTKEIISKDLYNNEILSQKEDAKNEVPIYKDIFVDVWYNELEHYQGQHVWYNNTVYRLKENQEKNTAFRKSNADKILEGVKLFDDQNKDLFFDKSIGPGDKFLDKNRLYMFKQSIVNSDTDLMIIQDIKNKKWVILLSNKVYRMLREINKSNGNYTMSFSVTENNDPNVLYRSLEVQIKDLLLSKMIEIPFQYDWEHSGKNVSIYVERYFDSYFYGVVSE